MADSDWVGAGESGGGGGEASPFWDTVNDFGRAVTNAATFGMGNRLKGYISGTGTDEQARLSEVARERSPIASVAGDVYGSFAIPALGAENLAVRGTAALAPTLGRAAPAVGRALGYGATGAVTGAAQGAGNTYTGNVPDYVQNALIGGAMGGVLGGVGGAAFGSRPAVTSARTPSAAEQEVAKTIAYRTLEQHPAQYTPASFAQRADDVTQDLRRSNYYNAPSTEGGSPRTFRTVEQMRDPPTAINPATGANTHLTLADIDAIRKGVTGDRIAGASPTDQGSARMVRNAIDDYIRNPPAGAAAPGSAAAAADASRIANIAHQQHGAFKRTQAFEELINNAERQAGATYSGLNLRNELQKAVKSGLKERAGTSSFSKAGYNDAELAALDRFSRGQGRFSQGLGYVDKYLGGGGGLGALAAGVGGGAALGGEDKGDAILKGLGVSGAGLALRMIGNRRAAGEINRMRDLIAQRSPLYQQRLATAPMVPGPGSPRTAKAMRDAVALELMKQTQPGNTSDWQ